MTHAQIMDYFITNKIRDTQPYEKMLVKVQNRINTAMVEYGGKLEEGQKVIGELMTTLHDICETVHSQRIYVVTSIDRLKKSYSRIGPTLRKINNISKVL